MASNARPTGPPLTRLALAGIVVLVGAAALRIALVDTPEGGRAAVEVPLRTSVASAIADVRTADGMATITAGPEIAIDEIDEELAGGAPAAAAVGDPEALGMV